MNVFMNIKPGSSIRRIDWRRLPSAGNLRSIMRLPALMSIALVLSVPVRTQTVPPRPYFTEPSVAPDRSEIAFVSGGDIWAAPADGSGTPRVLITNAESPAVVRPPSAMTMR